MIDPQQEELLAMDGGVQISVPGDMIAVAEDLWNRLPMRLVFDHMGHLPRFKKGA